MASSFPRASIELDYPLYALSFDPHSPNRLVVGGGGGASRTGVGNKMTVLESEQDQLGVAGELEFPKDEDSVMSLAFDGHGKKTTYVFAGVNPSEEEVAAERTSRHLRCVAIASTGEKAKVAEVSRAALFEDPDADTYQRLLRVAGEVGAAASGMGKEPQLVVFDAANPPEVRKVVKLSKDAEELDVVHRGGEEYLVVFCHKYELHLLRVTGEGVGEPELVFTMPDDHGERPAFRSVRFLTPSLVLAVSNLPGRRGALIQGIRLPGPRNEKGRIAITARIARKMSATALAVANVHAKSEGEDGSKVTDAQFVVAVAGNDCSISLYTVEHKTLSSIEVLSSLYPFCTLDNAHNGDSITGLAFSNPLPTSGATKATIKLASITLQKGVAVHSIPLKKHVDKGPPQTTRYVIAMRSRAPSRRSLVLVLSVMVLVLAVIGQGILELYGVSKPVVHAGKLFPGLYGSLRDPHHPPSYFFSQEYLVSQLSGPARVEGDVLVMLDTEPTDGGSIRLDVHDAQLHGPAKVWEDLSEAQKKHWREKLQEAGAWTSNMGESVFKGILFGELAGAVGRAMAG